MACGSVTSHLKSDRLSQVNSENQCRRHRVSEFQAEILCSPRTLTIGVSQSGETKDTLDALHNARQNGSKITSFCNVIGSTMSRLAENGAYLHAGPEFSVASTKAVTNMIALFGLLAASLTNQGKGNSSFITEMRKIPSRISKQLLEDDGSINAAVSIFPMRTRRFLSAEDLSSSPRGRSKDDEVAYLPCISYQGGETCPITHRGV